MKLLFQFGLSFFLLLMVAKNGHGQRQDSTLVPGNSNKTMGLVQWENLGLDWVKSDGSRISFPYFFDSEQDQILERYVAGIPDSLHADTLYLFISGIVGSVSLYAGTSLLVIMDQSWEEYVLKLPKSLIGQGLKLKLTFHSKEVMESKFERPISGLGGDFLLLLKDSVGGHVDLPAFSETKDIHFYPCDWRAFEWLSKKEAQKMNAGKVLGLPFRPKGKILADLSRQKIVINPSFTGNSTGFCILPEAIDASPFPVVKRPFYGLEKRSPDKVTAIVLVFFWLIALLFYRFIYPKLFSMFGLYLVKPQAALGEMGPQFQRFWFRSVLAIVRVFMLAITLSFLLHYLDCSGMISYINLSNGISFLHSVFAQNQPQLSTVFIFCFLVMLAFEAFKQIAMAYLGIVFGYVELSESFFRFENAAAFPLHIFLVLPGIALFFAPIQNQNLVLGIWAILALAFFIRRLFVIYYLFQGRRPIPGGLRILYICTLEILPWGFLL